MSAYAYGNPANWPFYHWINQSPDVVIVSIYYRLDSFGFLATPEFADEAIGDFNVGFLDQIEALRWIKKHIDAFGGDPNKVTINGQSAGGSSVELHLTSPPEDEHLFSAAIAQSVYRVPLPTPAQQQANNLPQSCKYCLIVILTAIVSIFHFSSGLRSRNCIGTSHMPPECKCQCVGSRPGCCDI